MRDAYQVATVRAAERALMEIVPDGALMSRAAAASGTPCRFTAASSCRLVSTPSPVVACSSMMMCPDCSPPSR